VSKATAPRCGSFVMSRAKRDRQSCAAEVPLRWYVGYRVTSGWPWRGGVAHSRLCDLEGGVVAWVLKPLSYGELLGLAPVVGGGCSYLAGGPLRVLTSCTFLSCRFCCSMRFSMRDGMYPRGGRLGLRDLQVGCGGERYLEGRTCGCAEQRGPAAQHSHAN
jgi:hypothetical protein